MFTDDVLFSHAHTLTGCPLDANSIIKFQEYRRLISCYPPLMSRETRVGMSMAFSPSMMFFWSYVPGMHVVVFTLSWSVARALASTPICCSILLYTTRTKPSADTWAIDPWVHVVPPFLCASLFQSVCIRVADDVFLVATWNLFVISFTRYRMPLLGAFPVDLACLRNHLLHACRCCYCGCHPQDTAEGRDRTPYSFSSIRAVVYVYSNYYKN